MFQRGVQLRVGFLSRSPFLLRRWRIPTLDVSRRQWVWHRCAFALLGHPQLHHFHAVRL